MTSRIRKRRRLLLERLQPRELLDADGLLVVDDRFELRQGSGVAALDVLANDVFAADYVGARQITSSSFGSRGGLIRVAEDGLSLEYELPADFAGAETFDYYIDFEHRGTVTVEIESPLREDLITVDPDGRQYALDVLANDPLWADYAGAGRITAVSHTRLGGEIRVNDDGTGVLYTPPAYETGKDTFVYFVDDIFSAVAQVNITNPLAEDRVLDIINETGTLRIDVLANDPFFEGYQGQRRITQILDNQGLSLRDQAIFAIADDGSAIEVATDGRGRETTETYSVRYVVDNQYESRLTVQLNSPVRDDAYGEIYNNELPKPLFVLDNDLVRYRDERYSTLDPRGYINLDVADRITGVGDGQLGGVVEIAPDGQNLLYTPAVGAKGYERFEYTVDGVHVATVSFYLSGPTDGGPVIVGSGGGGGGGGGGGSSTTLSKFCRPASDTANLNQNDGPTRIAVLENDFHEQGFACDAYTGHREITEISGARHGTVTIVANGGALVYTPHEDYVGTDSFQYVVDDLLSASVSINVVRRVRDDRFRVAPDTIDNPLNVTGNDLFGADYTGPGQVTDVLGGEHGGQLTIDGDHETIRYTPAPGFVGEDHFRYVVDGQLKADVTVFVSPSKDELLGRRDETLFWDTLIAEAMENYAHLFGQATSYFDSAFTLDYGVVGAFPKSATSHIFSETNVQVAGVDEADLIETDGENLYVLRGQELVIAGAWPTDELQVLSRVSIEGRPIGIYWQGDRLVVVSETPPPVYYDYAPTYSYAEFGLVEQGLSFSPYPRPAVSGETIATVIDVQDAAHPAIVHQTHLDGDYVESRRVGDSVFLVLRNQPVRMPSPLRVHEIVTADGSFLKIVDGDDSVNLAEIRATAESKKVRFETSQEYVARMTPLLSGLLPNFASYDADGDLLRAGLIVAPGDFFEPLGENRSVITVASINMAIDEPGISGSTAVLTSGGDDIYASSESLYVMDRAYTDEDGDVTKILKFDWNGVSGEIDFVSLGQVAGFTLDQFSMDEYDGHFRIATTMSNLRAGNRTGNSENAVWVLEDNGGLLQIVGDLQNVGLAEEIKSVRFIGERGFVTTFREIDPLFALDLADHARPTRVGYVTLPGYNSYMQPIDANHLLTIGHNGVTEGIGATQVVLFDISEITRPRIVGRHSFYLDSTSIAEQDHHAFGWFAPHNVLSIPLARNRKERVDRDNDGYQEAWLTHREDQLAVLEIDVAATAETRDGVTLRGAIDNDSEVLRSAFINHVLYSVGRDSVVAAMIDDPANVIGAIDLRPDVPVDPAAQPVDANPSVPAPLQLRDQWARGLADRAQTIAVDLLGSTIAPPVLLAWEQAANSGDARFVFDSGGRKILVSVDSNLQASLVSGDFQFAAPRVNRHQNPLIQQDVNGDGLVTSFDVLRIANELNNNGSHPLILGDVMRRIGGLARPPAGFLDVNGDGIVSAFDALGPVNWLNAHRAPTDASPTIGLATPGFPVAEGEAASQLPAVNHAQAIDAVFAARSLAVPALGAGIRQSIRDRRDWPTADESQERSTDSFFESLLAGDGLDI